MSFALKRHMAARSASTDDSPVPSWARRFTPAVERSAEEQAEIDAARVAAFTPVPVPAPVVVSDDASDEAEADDAEVEVEADDDADDDVVDVDADAAGDADADADADADDATDATEADDVNDADGGNENANAPLSLLDGNAKTVIAALDTGDNDEYLDALLAAETGVNGKNRKTVKAAITNRLATLDAAT